ncbi:MAG: ATP-binding protein, partial [Pseudomonadota bacterium]|nr:ATP-binding protein [Pseudomonadota bacterium]
MIVNIRKKAVFNWSGGKDSALALHTVLEQNEFEVVALLTTVNEETELSSM